MPIEQKRHWFNGTIGKRMGIFNSTRSEHNFMIWISSHLVSDIVYDNPFSITQKPEIE